MKPEELVRLLETVEELSSIQNSFDHYQKSCFQERPPEFFSLELCGEAGELANLEKKAWKGKTIDQKHFDDEAADVLIALMNYANARGIDLAHCVATKLKEIEQRRSSGTH